MSETRLDIEAIRARCEAATEGPWVIVERDDGDGGPIPPEWLVGMERHPRGYWEKDNTMLEKKADAEFIAHSREDIPALLARVAELEAGLAPFAGLRAFFKSIEDWPNEYLVWRVPPVSVGDIRKAAALLSEAPATRSATVLGQGESEVSGD